MDQDAPSRQHRVELSTPPASALRAVREAAEMWGAEWTPDSHGGRLRLPVVRGLRRGTQTGRLSVTGSAAGSALSFEPDASDLRLNRPAVVVLALGAAGGIAATLWPFYPALTAVAPLAVVLALGAWLLVASRLRASGPGQFLELVQSLSGDAQAPAAADAGTAAD